MLKNILNGLYTRKPNGNTITSPLLREGPASVGKGKSTPLKGATHNFSVWQILQLESNDALNLLKNYNGDVNAPGPRLFWPLNRDCFKTPRSRHSSQHYRSLLSVSEDNVGETKRRNRYFATVPNMVTQRLLPP